VSLSLAPGPLAVFTAAIPAANAAAKAGPAAAAQPLAAPPLIPRLTVPNPAPSWHARCWSPVLLHLHLLHLHLHLLLLLLVVLNGTY